MDADALFRSTGRTSRNLFFVGLIIAASGLVSLPLRWPRGLVYGFSVLRPFRLETKPLSKLLLPVPVVDLGSQHLRVRHLPSIDAEINRKWNEKRV